MTTATTTVGRDRHIPWLFVLGFAIVFAVNGTMIWFAVGSFSGLYTPKPRDRGLHYNDVVAAQQARDTLGWRVATLWHPEDRSPRTDLVRSLRRTAGGRPRHRRTGAAGREAAATRRRDGRGRRRPARRPRHAARARQLGRRHRGRARRRALRPDATHVPQVTDAALFAAPTASRTAQVCAHCGAPVRGRGDDAFCCSGCASAHAIIGAAGLDGFYARLEERRARRPEPLEADFATHAREAGKDQCTLELLVDGLDCAACVWLIESLLARNPAVTKARVHLSTRRLSLAWRGTPAEANAHAGLVAALGFRLAPYDALAVTAEDDREARELLRALAVAGFAAANVMLLSVAVWSGHAGSWARRRATLFHWLSALIALPAIAYAGQPFFRSAFAALRAGRTNMDVPISHRRHAGLPRQPARDRAGRASMPISIRAITLLFFLLIGRYLDRRARGRARHRGARADGADHAHRHGRPAGGRHGIAAPSMRWSPGDVRAGRGRRAARRRRRWSSEGASDARRLRWSPARACRSRSRRGRGSSPARSTWRAPLRVRVTAAGERTLLAEIVRLMEAAERGRSRFVALADRVARPTRRSCTRPRCSTFLGWFVLGGARLGPRAADRHRRADHHLPLRPGAGGAGRAGRGQHAAAARGRPAAISPTALERLAEIDHVVLRQDRHADAGPARTRRDAGRSGRSPSRGVAGGGLAPSAGPGAGPGAGPRPARRGAGRRRRRACRPGTRARMTAGWDRPLSAASPRRSTTGAPNCGSCATERRRTASPSPTGCGPTRPPPSRRFRRAACRSNSCPATGRPSSPRPRAPPASRPGRPRPRPRQRSRASPRSPPRDAR